MNSSAVSIFQPVADSSNKSEAIVLQIEAAIVGGHFQPGNRLPSERDLQSLFRTSRGAIREAMRTLRQKGLLDAKKGARGGYYVREVDINEAIDHLAGMIRQQGAPLGKLLEFQYAMDQAVLIAAITNATDSQSLSMLEFAMNLVDLCDCDEPDFDRIAHIDRKLNLLMVEMTGNPFFEWVMRTVQVSFRDYEFIVYEQPESRRAIAQNWQKTARAIQARDLQKGLRLYGHWYVVLEQCIEDRCRKTETGMEKANSTLSRGPAPGNPASGNPLPGSGTEPDKESVNHGV